MGRFHRAYILTRPQIVTVSAFILLVSWPLVGTLAKTQAQDSIAPETSANIAKLYDHAKKTQKYRHSDPNCLKDKCIAITFDDGPNSDTTPKILDALKKYNSHASFFLIGNKVHGNESIIRRMYISGNDVGNHSWDHKNFASLKPEQIKSEVSLGQNAIKSAGVPAPKLFRPPYGSVTLSQLKYLKMPVILWNVDPKDWSTNKPDKIVAMVMAQAKVGAIVVLHDKPGTAAAADAMFSKLSKKYKLVTVTQLMALNDKSSGLFLGHK